MKLGVTGLNNIVVLTNDVPRLAAFYHEILELPFFLDYEELEKPEEQWASIDLGNVALYIFHTTTPGSVYRRTGVNLEDPVGVDSIALSVKNLDRAVAILDGRVEWVHEGYTPWEHPGAKYRYRAFYDPDGNMIYVTEARTRLGGNSH